MIPIHHDHCKQGKAKARLLVSSKPTIGGFWADFLPIPSENINGVEFKNSHEAHCLSAFGSVIRAGDVGKDFSLKDSCLWENVYNVLSENAN